MAPYTTYSEKHGLIAVGDWTTNRQSGLNVLKFGINNDDEWKWEEMKMDTVRPSPSATMMDDDKLICCGGLNQETLCDFYDFKLKKWSKLNNLKEQMLNSGICTDGNLFNKKERIYAGGGSRSPQKVQYYDIKKNEWYSLPDANGTHKYHPILWIKDINILNIASAWDNVMERIDLRENKWNVYVKNNIDKTFKNIFGTIVPHQNEKVRLCV